MSTDLALYENIVGEEIARPRVTLNGRSHAFDLDQICGGWWREHNERAIERLLMMNFTVDEVNFAIDKLGGDAPINELVDFIIAAQIALIGLRVNIGTSKEEVERLQKEKTELVQKEEECSKQIKELRAEISVLTENLKKLKQQECEEKDKRIETADPHVTSLQKQAADLLLEYDRLLEDNQNLQNQTLGGYKK
ncbi:probable inactive DNA (cytosine-5)-methyltransferase DRM3 [Benincasa hispida]|uniref:probable inactive DNA (cytosine-5)-methyltransferase DRM3 n=1 Tax=Benincasa hispida TaxID=102211 RepID=UPI0018FF5EEB|nr:probable inactive DNA (cytosine-5)-methyltransferase DRM3 [Benincasa hispida]